MGSLFDSILKKISRMELPCTEHVESYMRHKWRLNRKPNTLRSSFHAVRSFVDFYSSLGKSQLQEIVSDDLESFVEHEQDRGLKVTTIKTRLSYIWAFLRYLVNRTSLAREFSDERSNSGCPIFCPGPLLRLMLESFSVPLERLVTVLLSSCSYERA